MLPGQPENPSGKLRSVAKEEKIMKAVIALIISLIGILCCFQAALAADLFYSGDVVIESVGINIDIDDEDATLTAVYLLRNQGSIEEQVDLQWADPSASLTLDGETLVNPVTFNPGERRAINVAFNLKNAGETTKTLSIDPAMLFDGKPHAEPAGTVLIEALLPEGVNALAWASQEPDEESMDGGRALYTWKAAGLYPTSLTLKWSTLGIDLSIEKSANPKEITEQDQIITIQLTLNNNGDTALENIYLVDQYVLSDFEMVEPLVESGTRENILYWEKHISSLGPGEKTTASYSVKYIATIPQIYEFDLNPTVVTVDGHLVSVSNKVRIKQSVELPLLTPEATPAEPATTPEPAEDETEGFPWVLVIGIIVAALIIIAVVSYVLLKRKTGGIS